MFDKKFKELLVGKSPKSLPEQELQTLYKQAIFETPTGKMVKRITGFQNIDFSPKKFIVDWENLSNTKAKRFTIRFIK